MLDRLLEIGGSFDWITPLGAFVQDVLNGPPAHFGIPPGAGWTHRDITKLLNRHGVCFWGLILAPDVLIFTVPQVQAGRAYYLLQRAGAPILYAPKEAVQPEAC